MTDESLVKIIFDSTLQYIYEGSMVDWCNYKKENSDCLSNKAMFKRLYLFDFQPTCENMLTYYIFLHHHAKRNTAL